MHNVGATASALAIGPHQSMAPAATPWAHKPPTADASPTLGRGGRGIPRKTCPRPRFSSRHRSFRDPIPTRNASPLQQARSSCRPPRRMHNVGATASALTIGPHQSMAPAATPWAHKPPTADASPRFGVRKLSLRNICGTKVPHSIACCRPYNSPRLESKSPFFSRIPLKSTALF
jgi:hypothetical protein